MIYNALILSHINYGLLLWGYNADRIYNLQKKSIRIIGLKKYNAHTEPLFKSFKLLKVASCPFCIIWEVLLAIAR